MNRLVVVGAGPAGLTLALQLARAGQPVTLLEARRDFARRFRGDALMPCGLEALARMGLWPLLERLPQRTLTGWSVWVEGRRLFQEAEPMGALQPCRLVPQAALLEALLQEARALPHFDWQPGATVSGLLERDTGEPGGRRTQPRVQGVRLSDGRTLEADLVIGCDGRDSALRRCAAIRLRPLGAPLQLAWLVLPDGADPGPDPTAGAFLTLVGGGAIASACRDAGDALQLGWLLQPEAPLPERCPQAWAEAIAALAPPALAERLRRRGAALQPPLRFRVQVGLAERWHRPGLLLLGDAAHPMSPIRAQGINMALRDSLVAARELTAALANAEVEAEAGCRPLTEASAGPRPLEEALDQACARIEAERRPEIQRMQALQLAEARQGHWLGHTALLRLGLARTAPLTGPLVRRLWRARQRPLREGVRWL